MESYDLVIVGGGINGTAIARDAAGRGLSVLLCEKDDLASHTSSSSTKLIHGGLRYLEYYEFRLVREALIEREVLLEAAPHIIWPMRFVLPYDKGLRPAWILRLGLFFYDSLGGRKRLPGTKRRDLRQSPHAGILEKRLKVGFEYSDCWVEDARLVVLNAMDARSKGADIKTRAEIVGIASVEGGYEVSYKSEDGSNATVMTKGIINSAGPWVDDLLRRVDEGKDDGAAVRMIKGSHIVTHKLYEGDHAYMFQNADNRIIFTIPYERDYTLIGTTDVPYDPSEGEVKISDVEVDYLIDAANEYFEKDFNKDSVKWTYSGVRPLYDDKSDNASAVTRDYVLKISEFSEGAPIMSIYGGKITTSRKLAEHAMQKLTAYYTHSSAKDWTSGSYLPGGDIEDANFDAFFEQARLNYPDVGENILFRLCRAYGTKISVLFANREQSNRLGEMFGDSLSEAELNYLIEYEFVTRAEDVLWRRSKLGLHMSKGEQNKLSKWFEARKS
ncbi:MAG: glycerol-3-phosphate dehydrogenase [Maricaulaceae bacterium]